MDQNLSNKEFFKKRNSVKTVEAGDTQVACKGRWIESCLKPDKFYKGWYPIRRCTFSGHESLGSAGTQVYRDTTSFRNCRVVCDICDHPDNVQKQLSADDCCCDPECKDNIVAPSQKEERLLKNRAQCSKPEVPTSTSGKCPTDAHWRFHDAHPYMPGVKIPRDCRIHQQDWFKAQMNSVNSHQKVYKALQQFEREGRLKEERELFERLRRRHKQKEEDFITRRLELPLMTNLPAQPIQPSASLSRRPTDARPEETSTPVLFNQVKYAE
ncbi:uncharacterized protein LOC131941305 [Physella acuta]|uniref:uncharacterized protein LOC131941305 n=1 Tax=Physella acuta TaxID=109671 RepID=UPI0027DDD891|nr:uncharacterized protein LOC131941305 [Physella acuta]